MQIAKRNKTLQGMLLLENNQLRGNIKYCKTTKFPLYACADVRRLNAVTCVFNNTDTLPPHFIPHTENINTEYT